MRKRLLFIFCITVCFFFQAETFAQSFWQNEQISIETFTQTSPEPHILIKLKPKAGWHILWDNPGDLGTPTTFHWDTPVTRLAESIPQTLIYDDIIGQYGYETEAYYLFTTKSQEWPNLEINWTACQEECLPQKAFLKISENPNNDEFKKAAKTFPLAEHHKATFNYKNGKFLINIYNFPTADNIKFISRQRGTISPLAEQKISRDNKGITITVEAEGEEKGLTDGLLIADQSSYLLHFNHNDSWFFIILLAFLGGFILNFMPCVFPILSLKALALTQRNQKNGMPIQYVLGVLLSFGILAFILHALRHGGKALGWGFQLQSPIFVALMLALFIFILLLMLGIIPPSNRILSYIGRFNNLNSFLTGFLAVLIASPCSGPFIGAAMGYALLRESSESFYIFISMGLGYAMPFALIEAYPQTLRRILPRPGKWMSWINKILAIPIFLTCLWLAWLLLSLTPARTKSAEKNFWLPYDAQLISHLIKEEKPILIDFTAKWCLTCILNEKNVLESDFLKDKAQKCGITLFKADWTEQNEEITNALETYGRASVPLYVFYPAGDTYVILPTLLTQNILNQYLNCRETNEK